MTLQVTIHPNYQNRPIESVYQTFDMGVHETSFKLIAKYVNRADCMPWPILLY